MKQDLMIFRNEMQEELRRILSFWTGKSIDIENGGFIGQIDWENHDDPKAEKGSVLNSRILWSFSSASLATNDAEWMTVATRAYEYFINHFVDGQFGGVYWSVDAKGNPLNRKKQVYAQAFGVYALAACYQATGLEAALDKAIDLFHLIEEYAYDQARGGYIDAFAENWQPMADMSLSEKDANAVKTMNTHLHVLEAYSCLYRSWSTEKLKNRIEALLRNFTDHIIDKTTGHLGLYFDKDWTNQSSLISYGHEIEAAWLLQEAAESLQDADWIQKTKGFAISLADAAMEGLDKDGGLWYEFEKEHGRLIKEKHWWPQAEAMVGFLNAWQVSGKEKYLSASLQCWEFTKKHICDFRQGEWIWGVFADYSPIEKDKIGIWKCPYHNTRACLEAIRRIAA